MMLVLAGYLVITALAAVSNGIELDDDGILTDIAKRQVSSATIPKFNDKPVAVNVSMFLQTIFLQFADRVPTLELIFYLRQVWIDPRLAFFNCTSNPKRSVPFSAKNFE